MRYFADYLGFLLAVVLGTVAFGFVLCWIWSVLDPTENDQ